MKKKTTEKKLRLTTESIRTLTKTQLDKVQGGMAGVTTTSISGGFHCTFTFGTRP